MAEGERDRARKETEKVARSQQAAISRLSKWNAPEQIAAALNRSLADVNAIAKTQ